MGRTVPTFNMFLQAEIDSWAPMRRALRREHQEAFDHLFTRVRCHVAEASATARPIPFDAVVMAVLLSMELQIAELQREVAELKSRQPAD